MFCTKRSYCDFVVWTESDIHIERILPDKEFWLKNVDRAKNFFVAAVLPELFGKFYSRPKQSEVSEEAEGQSSGTVEDPACSSEEESVSGTAGDNLYCYCNKPEEGDMVGCDNPACPYQWFHISCLNLKSLPTTKYWYCPECSKEKSARKRKKLK